MNLKSWIVTARLRTLPLSLSAVAGGIMVGMTENTGVHSSALLVWLTVFILLTAVLLQILSNFANDYGDSLSGLDNKNRVGPLRSLSQGAITRADLKRAIISLVFFTVLSGATGVGLAFYDNPWAFIGFGALGLLAVGAAITYTVGLVYGYHGFGDIAVFIFFGLTAVLGAEYMIAHSVSLTGIWFGAMAGFSSVLVLNVNNLRDYENDLVSGKNSVVVKLGVRGGKIYHALVLLGAFLCLIMCLANLWPQAQYLVFLMGPLSLPLLLASLFCINPKHVNGELDCMLKRTSLGAALINISLGVLFCVFG